MSRNVMPFLQAATAASCCGVLGNKNRMTTHRSLLAVTRWLSRGKALADKLARVIPDYS